jgi:Ca2+-binding EF-hand superfamily protein
VKNLTLATALFVLSATITAEAGSGTKQREEYIYAERVFSRYDVNHDRAVSDVELSTLRDGYKLSKKRVKFLMKHADTNKNGFLSESEIVHSYYKKHPWTHRSYK